MSELINRTYIVTGASKGFGLAITQALLAQGANVGLLARNVEVLEATVNQLATDKALAVPCDVSNKTQVLEAFYQVKEHFGSLNGVINNAGLAKPSDVENLDETEVVLQVQTNFVGTVFCCQAAIPLLRGEQNPRIINISSASAWHCDEMSHLSIYASTKAAVERFSRDLRTELQGDGIAVTCIRPGAAWTDFSAGWDKDKLQAGFDAWAKVGATMDIGMEVSHVADTVVHCLSYPEGVAVDLVEVRPNQAVPKLSE